MKYYNIIQENYTVKRLRLPLETDILIDIGDPIYTFDEVLGSVDLRKYLISDLKDPRGRIGYNPINLLKVILFGFMMNGYVSLRELEIFMVSIGFNLMKYHNKKKRLIS